MNEAREEKKKMLMRVWLGCERDNYWCSPHAKSCTFVSLNFIFLISSLDSPLVGIFFPFCVRCVWQFTIPKRWIFHFIFFLFFWRAHFSCQLLPIVHTQPIAFSFFARITTSQCILFFLPSKTIWNWLLIPANLPTKLKTKKKSVSIAVKTCFLRCNSAILHQFSHQTIVWVWRPDRLLIFVYGSFEFWHKLNCNSKIYVVENR